jgi:uncharacterized protein
MSNEVWDQLKKKDLCVAVIGATNDKTKYGNIIYRDLKNKGIKVLGVNPKATTIDGDKSYKKIQYLDIKPDILNFVLPPKLGLEVIKDAIELGYDYFWLQPGAESEEIIALLEAKNKKYLAYSCVMVETR